ncbi:MAG: hypothetical protein HY565_05935 [Candidatus Kerfeldbacteria bacterium]|nr:hypothetical protein [Candidatus Kerfeldbacteria bacterium]
MPDQNAPQIILDPSITQPLQPVPLAAAVAPTPKPGVVADADRRAQVQAELEKLQAEESSMLNNIRDWIAKVQGAETKQQSLERELFQLDRTIGAGPSTEQLAAEQAAQQAALTKQLQQAETQVKHITNQQKIDEKKAFDNYSAGGLDRQGLLEEMEKISLRYADQLAAAKALLADLNKPTESLNTNPFPPTPSPLGEGATSPASTEQVAIIPPPNGGGTQGEGLIAPTSTSTPSSLMQHLMALPEVQTGLARQLLIDLPNQGTIPLIERSADGNGIIISSSATAEPNTRCFIPDADLLRAGATAEDILSLQPSTLSSQEVTALTPAV